MNKQKKVGESIKYWKDTVKIGEEETGSLSSMVEYKSNIIKVTEYFYYLEDGTEIPRKL